MGAKICVGEKERQHFYEKEKYMNDKLCIMIVRIIFLFNFGFGFVVWYVIFVTLVRHRGPLKNKCKPNYLIEKKNNIENLNQTV